MAYELPAVRTEESGCFVWFNNAVGDAEILYSCKEITAVKLMALTLGWSETGAAVMWAILHRNSSATFLL